MEPVESIGSFYVSSPFSVSFHWRGRERIVTLKNGEDVLKLAKIYAHLLTIYGIEFELKERGL